MNKRDAEAWKAAHVRAHQLEAEIKPMLGAVMLRVQDDLAAIRALVEPDLSRAKAMIQRIEDRHGDIVECVFCNEPEMQDRMQSVGDEDACPACIKRWDEDTDGPAPAMTPEEMAATTERGFAALKDLAP